MTELEKEICKYLNLKVKRGYIYAYYGMPHNDGKPSGWQLVCHESKLKSYLQYNISEHHSKAKNQY